MKRSYLCSAAVSEMDRLRLKLISTLSFALFLPDPGFATEEIEMVGAFRFSEGLATVIVGGKHGYIDTQGKIAIPPIYTAASGMVNGSAVVIHETGTGYVNRHGKLLAERPQDFRLSNQGPSLLDNFSEADAQGKAKWGFKNANDDVVIEPKFDFAADFYEGLAVITVVDHLAPSYQSQSGYIDEGGNVVIPPNFKVASNFVEGLARVVTDEGNFFITPKGERAFPGNYQFAFDFSEGTSAVDFSPINAQLLNITTNGHWGYINKHGDVVIPGPFQQAKPFKDGYAAVKHEDGWGIINRQGEFVVAPRFDDIGEISEGMVAVRLIVGNTSKWGFINMQGDLIAPAIFDQARPFSEGFAYVRIDGKGGYIDHSGAYLWRPTQ